MKPIKHITWELIIVIASVLIFRSLWLLMDSVIDFNSTEFLITSLIIGIVLAGLGFRRLTHVD